MNQRDRLKFNNCLDRMLEAFLHLSRVPEEKEDAQKFLKALDEAHTLTSKLAKKRLDNDTNI